MSKDIEFVEFLASEDINLFLSDSSVDKTELSSNKKTEINVEKVNIVSKENIVKAEIDKNIDLSNVKTLEDLKKAINDFDHPLKQTALNMVFSRGNSDSPKVLFIGEAPGQDEDIKGIPFVGKAGQLLDKMIQAIKLTEKDFYITNVVNYRPENNRTPNEDEIKAFLPFLKKHIEIVKPQVICVLGIVSLKALFPNASGITKSRGKWLDYEGIPTIATFHPSYLLKFSSKKKEAWEDLQELQKNL